ncbi:MAG TPA: hypothetical protein VES93_00345 [Ornithinibacter sp.]|nr:hypothetical protein [Ornithinibacter sp.]
MHRAVLLPSPLLPARAYAPLTHALGRCGWGAVVAAGPGLPDGPGPVLAAYREAVSEKRPDLVVAHSNAGRYAVAAAGGVPVVHLDAALPPEHGDATLAPDGLLDHLAGLADDDGLLPPWTHWWSEEDLAAVVPDAEVLAGLRADEPRMPLAYFRSRLGAPDGWVRYPQAYLALGDTYAEETAFARGQGWPTTVLEGALHLHHLVDPDAVAAAVLDLAAALGGGGLRPARGATTTG